jgi:hypothetical protein
VAAQAPLGDRLSDEAKGETSRLRYRIAFFVASLVVLGLVVTLPFSVKSIVDDVFGSVTGRVIKLTSGRPDSARPNHTKLHLALVSIDETQLLASIRVSGHHRCVDCDWSDRVLFVSVTADDLDADGMPPSVGVTLSQANEEISEIIQLPVRGQPIHYPFDSYSLVVGVALQRVRGAGPPQTLSAVEASGHLLLSVQELLTRQVMIGPTMLNPATLRAADDPFEYVQAFELKFERPRYLRVLAVILVLLITSAAAYSVFLRPLHDLVLNSGGLVLGVWAIRAILMPGNLYYQTAVDLALSIVIVFTLGAILVRALMFAHDQADLHVLRRRPRR